MRFGDVWTSVKGNDIGSVGEIVLSGNETITHVHYWVYLSKTNAIEFKSSEGAVYGPWGATSDQEITIQVIIWLNRFAKLYHYITRTLFKLYHFKWLESKFCGLLVKTIYTLTNISPMRIVNF